MKPANVEKVRQILGGARRGIARGFDSVMTEVLAIAGVGAIVYGVHLMHPPSAFLVVGAFLLLAAWGRAGTPVQAEGK